MDAENIAARLPEALSPWYDAHKRDLPWRRDREPYHIWISEIMLQQTRVEAVKGYYTRFLAVLPAVEDLANCPDTVLEKLWEGLGYYSRMRNLKKAAQMIMAQGGAFPREYEDVRSLPGIGPYTAGAICSIAYDLPVPAVDGNVLRVLARLLNDASPADTPAFRRYAENLLREIYPSRAGDFTQSLIELGATVCGPNREPDCENCPCRGFCRGREAGTAAKLPVRTPKKDRRQEDMTVFILQCDDCIGLRKRPSKGLLAGMWEFPNTMGRLSPKEAVEYLTAHGFQPWELKLSVEKKHIFTHVEWHMIGIYGEVKKQDDRLVWMTKEQIQAEAGIPTAFRQFWEGLETKF